MTCFSSSWQCLLGGVVVVGAKRAALLCFHGGEFDLMILNSFVEMYVSSREVSFQKQKEGRKEEKSLPISSFLHQHSTWFG